MWMNLASILLFPAWCVVFYEWFGISNVTLNVDWFWLPTLLTLVVHELIHYATLRTLNTNVKISLGFRFPISLLVKAEGEMSYGMRIMFLLSPIMVLTVLFWMLSIVDRAHAVLWILLASINASGSSNDLWRVGMLLKQQKRSLGRTS